GAPEVFVAHDHSQATFASELANAIRKCNDFPQTCSAVVAAEQVLFDGFFFGGRKQSDPIVAEYCGVDGIGAIDHDSTPMQPRSWWIARWRITRTLASERPRKVATSA